jgi:hypothetical protein
VNKLFEPTQEKIQEVIKQSPDRFFDCDNITRSAEVLMAGFEQLKKEEDIEIRRQKAFAWIEQQARLPLSEVEEIQTHFYENGIEGGIEPLKIALKLRQLELIERWNGNRDANILNIIQNYIQ